jgi:NhaP-type Na+/H+ or K+/H+ antiporter
MPARQADRQGDRPERPPFDRLVPVLLLVYAIVLLVAALISDVARRSALSASLLLLVVGFALGPETGGLLDVGPHDPLVTSIVELALVATLFTDGMRVEVRRLRDAWALPARALGIGMPITFALTALLAHVLGGASWLDAALVGAVLSPTDPVLASAIVGRKEVPVRMRRLLNVESGLNDGIALPVVLILLSLGIPDGTSALTTLADVALGVIIGIALPGAVGLLIRGLPSGIAPRYEPLVPASVALLLLGAARLLGANEFLAAFIGGAVLANVAPDVAGRAGELGESVAEMLKLAGILVFGALISPAAVASLGIGGWVFALVALTLVRPVSILIATLGTSLPLRDRLVVGWFGPKGFSTILYALLVLGSRIGDGSLVFHLAALVVAGSVLAHTTTDAIAVAWYARQRGPAGESEKASRAA